MQPKALLRTATPWYCSIAMVVSRLPRLELAYHGLGSEDFRQHGGGQTRHTLGILGQGFVQVLGRKGQRSLAQHRQCRFQCIDHHQHCRNA